MYNQHTQHHDTPPPEYNFATGLFAGQGYNDFAPGGRAAPNPNNNTPHMQMEQAYDNYVNIGSPVQKTPEQLRQLNKEIFDLMQEPSLLVVFLSSHGSLVCPVDSDGWRTSPKIINMSETTGMETDTYNDEEYLPYQRNPTLNLWAANMSTPGGVLLGDTADWHPSYDPRNISINEVERLAKQHRFNDLYKFVTDGKKNEPTMFDFHIPLPKDNYLKNPGQRVWDRRPGKVEDNYFIPFTAGFGTSFSNSVRFIINRYQRNVPQNILFLNHTCQAARPSAPYSAMHGIKIGDRYNPYLRNVDAYRPVFVKNKYNYDDNLDDIVMDMGGGGKKHQKSLKSKRKTKRKKTKKRRKTKKQRKQKAKKKQRAKKKQKAKQRKSKKQSKEQSKEQRKTNKKRR
jgi:hypothetical protein